MNTLASVAAIVVSIAVLFVQYANWHTANRKVVVDLFDKRIKVYTDLETVLSTILQHGAVDGDTLRNFLRAEASARFLFGHEVTQFLAKVRKDVVFMSVYTDDTIDRHVNRDALIEKKYQSINRLSKFFEKAAVAFGPYIQITQMNRDFWRPWARPAVTVNPREEVDEPSSRGAA